MRFSETELKRILHKGINNVTFEEEIAFNILNFIHCIHLNNQDFYSQAYNSKFFGDLEMTFKKGEGRLIGHCQAIIKKENKVIDYLFTENGFEKLKDVMR